VIIGLGVFFGSGRAVVAQKASKSIYSTRGFFPEPTERATVLHRPLTAWFSEGLLRDGREEKTAMGGMRRGRGETVRLC